MALAPSLFECPRESIDTLRFLTQIPIESARVFTIEESGIERPFFEVRAGNTTYDSRSVGLGELASFYLWWSLKRVSPNTVLLVEEPESYLSPMCQAAFADVLAKYTVQKKPFVILTTHSPEIIQHANRSSLRFAYILGIPNLSQIVFGIRGAEAHDWLELLQRASQLSREQLHLMLFRAWIQKAENHDMAKQYFQKFQEKMRKE